jgi:hypothetical protein
MERDQAISKIKKCLALGRSSNEHEAAAAMRQAQKLMEAFNVDATDVELSEVCEARAKAPMQTAVVWDIELGFMISEAFGCKTFVSFSCLPGQGLFKPAARQRVFVGVGPSAEIATYTYDVLSRQCASARRAHIAKQKRCKQATKTARGDRFALHWVFAVKRLVHAFAGSEQRTHLLEAYIEREHPDLTEVKAKRRDLGRHVRSEDSWAGAEAGSTVTLQSGVGHSSAPLLR